MKLLEKIKSVIRKYFVEGEVYYINGSETLLPPLDKDEEVILLEKSNNGDLEARNKLIEHNLRLVVYVAKRFETNSFNLEDLISIGTLGLIKAISTFKCDKNIKLATYASRCIENEILMLIRANKKHKCSISIEDVLGKDDEDNEITIADLNSDEDKNVEKIFENNYLSEKLDRVLKKYLSSREYQIICMRYGLNGVPMLPQREVAEKLGISRSYISRLETKAIDTLKSCLNQSDYEI